MKTLIILIFFLTSISCHNNLTEVNKFNYRIETRDVKNFWSTYDKLSAKSDSVTLIQNEFILNATADFNSFIKNRPTITAQSLTHSLTYYPNFWKTVRFQTMKCYDIKPQVDKMYSQFRRLYPKFAPPNICFGITPINSGGTTDKNLILIGTEIASVNPKIVDISEIESFFKEVFINSDGDLLKVITHESVHTQQRLDSLDEESLLALAIIEGGADFVAEKVLQKRTISKAIYTYGEEHESDLWSEFSKNVTENVKRSNTDWFYNYQGERPADLGYYIGYKICKSYYNQSKNKTKAIYEIINVNDFEVFLNKSKYKGIGN